MSRRLLLEPFDEVLPAFAGFAAEPLPEAVPEPAAGLAADDGYERGYRAGWDDCERGAEESRRAVSAELARNLQELGFTFHEARAHVLAALQPLLDGIVGKVLPRLAAGTLGAGIVEELAALAETAADAPVTILVSPASREAVARLLDENAALPHRLVAEESLSDWQVFFRLGDHERQLDLGETIDRIGARLAAFSDQTRKVLRHG